MSAEAMTTRLRLRPYGRNRCGRYTLAVVPTCQDTYEEPNYRLDWSTACSPAAGPGSWRRRRIAPVSLSTVADALLGALVPPGLEDATPGTYAAVALTTDGAGEGAVATVVVTSSAVVGLTLTGAGRWYVAGDTLTIPAGALGAASTAVSLVIRTEDFSRPLVCP